MKQFRKFFSRRSSSIESANFARDRVAKSMPGESAALASVRLGCMSF